ncbi:SDR family NAD(P)-dependent oxidoreductase [Sphingomonas sp. Leaf412]|uniref:SDR family NAD(P)-dependent oxidoreductase n=1 Tax=Sphingomonas sp. Leaf412 TaxID=1736370 RepID=UPI0009E71D46|nr:SDR family oxidoreductase [Sphingomonas sp. Leaf412]
MKRLEGKAIVVTGAGSGIGEACAVAYAREGARVVVTSKSRSSERVAAAIRAAGGEAQACFGDLADEAAVERLIDVAIGAHGRIDVLHNNAAVTGDEILMDRDVASMATDIWDVTMAVNVRGPMLCAKHAIPHMLKQGGGNIIATGSSKALQGDIGQTAYSASKAALHNLTYNIAAQYGKQGIRANVLMVGLILTDATRQNIPPPILDLVLRHKLTPFIGTPDDCAAAAVFLASDDSRYTTGQALHVDGGFASHSPTLPDMQALFAQMTAPTDDA